MSFCTILKHLNFQKIHCFGEENEKFFRDKPPTPPASDTTPRPRPATPLRREAVVFTIKTAGHSLKRNTTVGGRYHSYKTTWRRRTFIQRQSQSTVMAQEKIAAELMNVEYPDSTGKTTSEILIRKQSIQSRSIWSKDGRFRAGLSCLQFSWSKGQQQVLVGGTASLWLNDLCCTSVFKPFAETPISEKTQTHTKTSTLPRARTHTPACMHTRTVWVSLSLTHTLSLSLSLSSSLTI